MTRTSFLLAFLVIGCSMPSTSPDAAATPDAAHADAALGVDTGAATADGGALDTGSRDTGSSLADAFVPDAGADAATSDVTTLRIVYPAGHTITVRGSGAPLSWTASTATTFAGGVYELQIHGLAAAVELKALLDDDTTWSLGPNYHLAPGQTIEIQPRFHTANGRVTTLIAAWSSPSLGNTRAVYAYLPAAYDENTAAHFPVLYMHDGQNLFDPAMAFGGNEWRVDETMNAAANLGRCADLSASSCNNDGECTTGVRCDTFEGTIVIGVANTSNRIGEYTPTMDPANGGGNGDAYLGALVTELRPMVDTMLRTRTGAADTGMMGSSLGGLISAHAAVARSSTFGLIGAMSPSTWWDGTEILGEVPMIASHATRPSRVYVDSGNAGTSNDDVTNTASLAMAFRDVGYVEGTSFHYVVQAGGQHSEVYWAQRLPGALAFLLPRRERAL